MLELFLNCIGDDSSTASLEVMMFVRGLVQEYDSLRGVVLERLVQNLDDIKTSVVYRVALWILGNLGFIV